MPAGSHGPYCTEVEINGKWWMQCCVCGDPCHAEDRLPDDPKGKR